MTYAICTHSTPDSGYIVFSAFRDSLSIFPYANLMKNSMNDSSMRRVLTERGVGYKRLIGKYEGTKEMSVICSANDYDKVADLLNKYEQDTYMYVVNHKHGLRKAYILPINMLPDDPNVKHYFEGYLRSVPESLAKQQIGYSYDPLQDIYFCVSPSDNTQDGTYGGLLCVS